MPVDGLQNLRLEIRDDAIAILTIARERAMNALNPDTIAELDRVLWFLEGNTPIRALIVTGEGSKAFVAGADISRMPDMAPADAEAFSREGSRVLARLEQLPIPVIAAVNGFALGGGCELALACDFIYAAEHARFGQPEVNLGIIAGFGGTQRLPRKVPYGMAMELLMNGAMIDAQEALRIGLVNRVVPAADLLPKAIEAAALILTRGPLAVAATKRAVQQGLDRTLGEGLDLESTAFGGIFDTADAREGVAAFLQKRKAEFRGA